MIIPERYLVETYKCQYDVHYATNCNVFKKDQVSNFLSFSWILENSHEFQHQDQKLCILTQDANSFEPD